jgi:ribosomal protein S18 acetylase RimI-like enzyme
MPSLARVLPVSDVLWRPLAAGDIAYVAALEAQIHAAPWTIGNFRDAIATGYSACVGEYQNRIVAYGILMLAPGEAQVLNLSVVPDWRRHGFGRALLRRFVAVAVGRGTAYYPGAEPSAPREDALVMRLPLGTGSIAEAVDDAR